MSCSVRLLRWFVLWLFADFFFRPDMRSFPSALVLSRAAPLSNRTPSIRKPAQPHLALPPQY